MNFQKLALSFMYQDQKVQLQGVRETTKIMDANGLDKMTHNSGHLFMIRVLPAESLTEEESDDIHLEIVTLFIYCLGTLNNSLHPGPHLIIGFYYKRAAIL